jgi:hypothetical protein
LQRLLSCWRQHTWRWIILRRRIELVISYGQWGLGSSCLPGALMGEMVGEWLLLLVRCFSVFWCLCGSQILMIAVIDYKAGNLTSVVKALNFLDAREVVVTQSPEDVLRADKIVLPGVGHFQATQLLKELGLRRRCGRAWRRVRFLGICVGLQWLLRGRPRRRRRRGWERLRACASGFRRRV